MRLVDANTPGFAHLSLSNHCPDERKEQQADSQPSQPGVLEPVDRHQVEINTGPKRIDKYHSNDDRKQELENSADEIMCVIRSLENDRIDTSPLPNHERTPEEGCAEVSEKIKRKKILQWHSSS